MRNKSVLLMLFIFIFVLMFFSGCPQPDSLKTDAPQLHIIHNDKRITLLELDPNEDVFEKISIVDPVSGNNVSGSFSVNTSSVRIERDGLNYNIYGMTAGGMGMITFTAAGKTGVLRVIVRNWKKENVHRNTLYANMTVYNEDLNVPYDPKGQTSYHLIVKNGFHYEAPDGLSSRETNQIRYPENIHRDNYLETDLRKLHPVPHIIQTRDDEYLPSSEYSLHREVFKFLLHHEHDGDMVGGYDDRQRLEIKTMDGEYDSEHMYSRGNGDTFTHRWKFRLPHDFRVSSEYTHIHQLKPEGGDSGNPTFTLTGRRLRTGREVLQLIYRGPIRANGDPSVNWYPCEVDLQPFRGEWIYAEEIVTYDNPGTYSIKLVRLRDMKVLMEYTFSPEIYNEVDPFVMYRPQNIYIRPKFGIYRRILHMTPFGLPNLDDPVLTFLGEPLNEQGDREIVILFADFEMDKLIR